MNAVAYMIKRDLLLVYRQRAELVNPLLFFILVILLFPLGIGVQPKLISQVAPAIIWVAALLAVMLSIDRLFRSDFQDGTLEHLLLSSHPLSLLVLGKIIAHWLVTGLPLILLTPLLAVFLGLNVETTRIIMVTLVLGTPALSALGAIGAALTVGLRRGGVLLAILVIPLYIPVLIFATMAVEHATTSAPVIADLSMLTAFLILSVTLAPLPAAAALKVSIG